MVHTNKKTTSFILLFVFVTSVLLNVIAPLKVHAASAWSNINRTNYMKCYLQSSRSGAKVYSNKACTKNIGTIYVGDEIHVYAINNGVAYVSYPLTNKAGKRKEGYIKTSVLTPNNVTHTVSKAKTKVNTAKRPGASTNYGYVSKNDTVIKVAESGKYSQIVYPISGKCYKMAWVSTSNYSKYIQTTANQSTSNNSKAQQIANYALSQVGVSDYKGDNNVIYNTWYYGRQVSGRGKAWCAAFVSYVSNKCGISTNVVPKTASASSMKNWFEKKGQFYYSQYYGGNYMPQIGDIVFYHNGSRVSHVGIVTGNCNGNYLNVVEGNVLASNGDYKVTHFTRNTKRRLDSSYVYGFAHPAY